MHVLGDAAAREPDLGLLATGLGIRKPADELAGHGGRQVGRVDVDFDPGGWMGRLIGHESLFFANALATAAYTSSSSSRRSSSASSAGISSRLSAIGRSG